MRLRRLGLRGVLGAAILVLACSACDAHSVTIAPAPSTPGGGPLPSTAPGIGSSISAPRHALSGATLVVASGVATLTVHADDLGDDLFRGTVNSGQLVATVTGDVVTMTTAGSGGSAVVADITVNSRLTWSVKVAGGATAASVDLSRVRAEDVEFTSGTAFTGVGWDTATNRFDILCSAGVSLLSVDRAA